MLHGGESQDGYGGETDEHSGKEKPKCECRRADGHGRVVGHCGIHQRPGARWERSQYWQQLKPFFRGNSLKGKYYIAAIQGSKICIGLLSKGNRDLHTTRTFEIPFVGSLFCAERTSEHADLFKENEEAVFWTNAEECAEKCRNLLNNEELINKISQNGRAKITQTKRGNEDVVRHILKSIN